MAQSRFPTLIIVTLVVLALRTGLAQQAKTPQFAKATIEPARPVELASLKDHATEGQIREYFQLSGELNDYRERWIGAVDKNRSIGAPYWPESFWIDLKAEMRKTDLAPMRITLYQHYVSRATMKEVIDAYHSLGAANFTGSPMCFKLGEIQLEMKDDADKLTLAKTQEVTLNVYARYKSQIAAARVKYEAEHPGWVNKP
jgi:hypothetical protein